MIQFGLPFLNTKERKMNRRIALAIEGEGRESRIAAHFARCSKFIVVELNEKDEEVKTENYFNPLAGQHSGSCQIPGYVRQFNVSTIIAGGMGQKAVNNFHNFGIEVVTASDLSFSDALDLYLKGEISGYEVCSHHHDHEHGHHHHHHHHTNN